ncbi:MAG: P-II family nitrogen regulator [Clostridiales bacterium]|nr:P-II family nitrogen regulator [Clostridiales bacterium]
MANLDSVANYELMCVVINYGMGSRVMHKAKQYGISGGTVFLGRGTVDNALSKFLSLYDERKEIVLLGTDNHTADYVSTQLKKDFHFEKSNHGIIFTTSMSGIVGSSRFGDKKSEEGRGVNKTMYQIIITIVNRGKAEDVIEAAEAVGSKGGTIINARGSGMHETSKLFNMEIEPEKEIVMILSKEDITDTIVSSIREKLKISKPGNGVIFIQNVNKTYGIYE